MPPITRSYKPPKTETELYVMSEALQIVVDSGHLPSFQDRLSLRSVNKQLRKTVSEYLNKARLRTHTNSPKNKQVSDVVKFLANGWPTTLTTLEIDNKLDSKSIKALLDNGLPMLEDLRIEASPQLEKAAALSLRALALLGEGTTKWHAVKQLHIGNTIPARYYGKAAMAGIDKLLSRTWPNVEVFTSCASLKANEWRNVDFDKALPCLRVLKTTGNLYAVTPSVLAARNAVLPHLIEYTCDYGGIGEDKIFLGDDDVAALAALPPWLCNLQKLEIYHLMPTVSLAGFMEALGSCSALTELSLRIVRPPPDEEPYAHQYKFPSTLSTLHKLKLLTTDNAHFDALIGVKFLQLQQIKLRNLYENYDDNEADDDEGAVWPGFAQLQAEDLPQLERLYLSGVFLDEDGVSSLGRLLANGLKVLRIDYLDSEDAGLLMDQAAADVEDGDEDDDGEPTSFVLEEICVGTMLQDNNVPQLFSDVSGIFPNIKFWHLDFETIDDVFRFRQGVELAQPWPDLQRLHATVPDDAIQGEVEDVVNRFRRRFWTKLEQFEVKNVHRIMKKTIGMDHKGYLDEKHEGLLDFW